MCLRSTGTVLVAVLLTVAAGTSVESEAECEELIGCACAAGLGDVGCVASCPKDYDGSPRCQCSHGFMLDTDGLFCIDDNECERGGHYCSCGDHNVVDCITTCVNTEGSYVCECDRIPAGQLQATCIPDLYVDITEPCHYPEDAGIGSGKIPDESMWSPPVNNEDAQAKFGRLYGTKGGGAWTAGSADTNQYLGIDLGVRQVMTGVTTQGRNGSGEYVTEYQLAYSEDNVTWSTYSNEFGTPFTLPGNTDDNSPVSNDLDPPVFGRYVRFHPQRWNLNVSMRVEVRGCRYDVEGVSLDGASSITCDVSGLNQSSQSRRDYLRMRFLTGQRDGLLFYAGGNTGDYFRLELSRGHLYLHINLGSTLTSSGATTLRTGSSLADSQWHEVMVTRDGHMVELTLDGLTIANRTNGEFDRLYLDRQLHLGGIDFQTWGKHLKSRHNFTGCMENVWFNYIDLIKEARSFQPRFALHGSVLFESCQVEQIISYTFPSVGSYLTVIRPFSDHLRFGFEFRTFQAGGLLLQTALIPSGSVTVWLNGDGLIEYSIDTYRDPEIMNIITNRDSSSKAGAFTDGLWHTIDVQMISADSDSPLATITVTVDGHVYLYNRQLVFNTAIEFNLGGTSDGLFSRAYSGFSGCMRRLTVQGQSVNELPTSDTLINHGAVRVDSGCPAVRDLCHPNPCEHGGTCSQDHSTYACNCSGTGYEGEVCHTSNFFVSCEEARLNNPTITNLITWLDIDGSGPLQPFHAVCSFDHDTEVATTTVGHEDAGTEVKVDGWQYPGSYVKHVMYDAQREVFDELIERASYCEQYIKWRCRDAKLLSDPGSTDPTRPKWGWWVGRSDVPMFHWGGASFGSGQCACALRDECKFAGTQCNCDAGLANQWLMDDGFLRQKEHLPVMELHFGDTGTIGDHKQGFHELGPLQCCGDKLFDSVVTFRKADATIELTPPDPTNSADIRFSFRTRNREAVFLQSAQQSNFFEVKLVFGNIIHFRFDVGNGMHTLEVTAVNPLDDDVWHTVLIERNRKQATVKLDNHTGTVMELEEPIDQLLRTPTASGKFVIGAAADYTDGFVGCMRGLMINGEMVDLRGMVERGEFTYGVGAGRHSTCASNPCLNGGVCTEFYSHYVCNCVNTRGSDCGREVGVTMQPNYMIKLELERDFPDWDADIIIGFSTWEKKGTLMRIRNDDEFRPEYISIEMNNNGGIKVALDVGFERDELNTAINQVDLANGQPHLVVVTRTNRGRSMKVSVDSYPPAYADWSWLPDSADTQLDNPRYVYLGRNETTRPGDGFKGCLFRAQFGDFYPLMGVFRDPRPDYVTLEPEGQIKESMCGMEEEVHDPEPSELRPTLVPTDRVQVIGDTFRVHEKMINELESSNSIYLLREPFLSDAILFNFRAYFQTNVPVLLQIWRPSNDSLHVKQLVWQLDVTPTMSEGLEDINLRECFYVKRGDRVGVFSKGSSLSVAYTSTNVSTNASFIATPTLVYRSNERPVLLGSTARFQASDMSVHFSLKAFYDTLGYEYGYRGCPDVIVRQCPTPEPEPEPETCTATRMDPRRMPLATLVIWVTYWIRNMMSASS